MVATAISASMGHRDQWDEWTERIRPIVKDAVRRMEGGLAAFRGQLGREDLVQECLIAGLHAMPRFDPERGNLSTYINRVCFGKLKDLWRSKSRRLRWEQAGAADEVQYSAEPSADHLDLARGAEPLAEWLGRVYAAARRMFPSSRRVGRKHYSLAQCIAIAVLMREEGINEPAARELFSERPDLCVAVRLFRLPSRAWFFRATSLAAEAQMERP